jgi:hypothetical protein
MPRTTRTHSTPNFVVDPHTLVRNSGRQIDWDAVGAEYEREGRKFIPAGTPVGETAGGEGNQILVAPNAAAPVGLLASDAIEGDRSAAKTGYGVLIGGVIYRNLLPVALSGANETALRDAGAYFVFENYTDDRSG